MEMTSQKRIYRTLQVDVVSDLLWTEHDGTLIKLMSPFQDDIKSKPTREFPDTVACGGSDLGKQLGSRPMWSIFRILRDSRRSLLHGKSKARCKLSKGPRPTKSTQTPIPPIFLTRSPPAQ